MKTPFKRIVWTMLLTLVLFPLEIFPQELILDDGMLMEKPTPGDGIWSEKPVYSDTSTHKYTVDNISYKLGNVFIYDYYYLDASGKKKKFLFTKNESSKTNALNLSDYENLTDSTIAKVMLRVTDKRETYAGCDSSCTQTTISYSYLIKNTEQNKKKYAYDLVKDKFISCGAVSTGVVDNRKNSWIHPPRQFTFRILQLSPFPFYQQDEEVNHWAWNVLVGGVYLDPRWTSSKEKIAVRTDYTRQPEEALSTAFGKLTSKVTTAQATLQTAKGEIKTYLKSYYHAEYGFLKLEYTLVNGAKMVFDLVEKQ